jgi:hypothetical protein
VAKLVNPTKLNYGIKFFSSFLDSFIKSRTRPLPVAISKDGSLIWEIG